MTERKEWLKTFSSIRRIERSRSVEVTSTAFRDAMKQYGMLDSTISAISAIAQAKLDALDAEIELPETALKETPALPASMDAPVLTSGCNQR